MSQHRVRQFLRHGPPPFDIGVEWVVTIQDQDGMAGVAGNGAPRRARQAAPAHGIPQASGQPFHIDGDIRSKCLQDLSGLRRGLPPPRRGNAPFGRHLRSNRQNGRVLFRREGAPATLQLEQPAFRT